MTGLEETPALLRGSRWDAIVSDDRKLWRLLQALSIPVLTPSALLVTLAREGSLTRNDAMSALAALSPLVSPDEYATARLSLDALKSEEKSP